VAPTYLPSPSSGVWNLGPFPVRAYALAIILGVVAAVVIGERRWEARGGTRGLVTDVATLAVPGGIVGARIYHVVTSPDRYLDDPLAALYIWQGGLGIPGGIAGGFLVSWLILWKRGIAKGAFADAVAPGVAVAQAIGRLGNWFNQELFGRPTTVPWALEIDPVHRPDDYQAFATFHPTFLYELLWNVAVAGLVIWADRRFRLGHGRAFALYLAAYTVGRFWIEALRIDESAHVLGLRLNQWTSVLVFVGAVTYIVVSARLRPGREDVVERLEPDQDSDRNQQGGAEVDA
jgi:prolipoprotein diacylglyceryl transferase